MAVDRFSVPLVNRPFRVRGLGEAYLATMTRPAFTALAYRILTSKDATSKAEVEAYLRLLKHGDGGRGFLHTMRGFELTSAKHELWRDALRSAPFPTQAIWGTQDPVLAADREGAAIRDELELAAFRRVRAKHLVPEEQPEAIADEVAQVASRVDTARSSAVSN
jgi:haloalkane dehalogenase